MTLLPPEKDFDLLPENALESTPFSVTSLSQALKQTIERDFAHVRVRGELTGVKYHGSGHVYFSLRDDVASIDGVCWRAIAQKLSVQPAEGMEVIATGRITTYPGRSKYQMMVTHIALAGVGALLKQVEALKKALEAEGLFAPDRKKRLPSFPQRIGVITSPTGAVIRDIIHRIEDRYPCHIIVWPTLVQGEGAESQIVCALAGFNDMPQDQRPDLIILARGGGSVEDLMVFNSEPVVRAVANSALPVITGVGHETDTTLVDYVADLRAPTPTGAAEMITPVASDLRHMLSQSADRMHRLVTGAISLQKSYLENNRRPLDQFAERLLLKEQEIDGLYGKLHQHYAHHMHSRTLAYEMLRSSIRPPQHIVDSKRVALSTSTKELDNAMTQTLKQAKEHCTQLNRVLQSLSYKNTLARGYAVVRQGQTIVTDANLITKENPFAIEFRDGIVNIDTLPLQKNKKPSRERTPRGSTSGPTGEPTETKQTSLF